MASYAPYKVKEAEDIGAGWREMSEGERVGDDFIPNPPKGLCQFHNPKSKLFITEEDKIRFKK